MADICMAMESIAPPGLAESWDNVGLLAGDPSAPVEGILLCVDLTDAVVRDARGGQTDLILAYHPPIFRPIAALRADGPGPEAAVFQCIRSGIAVYASHTALDAAEGGTNDTLAALCGLTDVHPLQHVDQPGDERYKLVVFVPPASLEAIADAMFSAGAGHIGDYSRCSFRIPGQGTFFGGESTSPTVGKRGRMEYADEIRLESVVPVPALPAVIRAMCDAHPYEEPAFDLYPLKARPVAGMGRVGTLPRPTTLTTLARKLKRATGAHCVQTVGPTDRRVRRAVIVAGAAGSLPLRFALTTSDVIITGEIRHHDALTIQRRDATAIALGHWSSEHPVIARLADRLQARFPKTRVQPSASDQDPFRRV